jgi:hypothetical protein
MSFLARLDETSVSRLQAVVEFLKDIHGRVFLARIPDAEGAAILARERLRR